MRSAAGIPTLLSGTTFSLSGMNLSLAGLRSEAAAKRAEHAKEREIALRARAAELEDALLVLTTKMLEQRYRLPANELAAMRSESEAIEDSLLQVTEQLLEDEVERELEQTDETVQCQLTLAFMQGLPHRYNQTYAPYRSVSVCMRAHAAARRARLIVVLSACCIILLPEHLSIHQEIHGDPPICPECAD